MRDWYHLYLVVIVFCKDDMSFLKKNNSMIYFSIILHIFLSIEVMTLTNNLSKVCQLLSRYCFSDDVSYFETYHNYLSFIMLLQKQKKYNKHRHTWCFAYIIREW